MLKKTKKVNKIHKIENKKWKYKGLIEKDINRINFSLKLRR